AYRSSVSPVGMRPKSPHRSGPAVGTTTSCDRSTRSCSPIVHLSTLSNWRGGGMSAGLPRGAPLSTHFPILAISSSLSDGSFLNFWMPMFFSMYHGGISRAAVCRLMADAHGRTCSYVRKGIGAIELGRWQFWQLRCRIGRTSFVNVTSPRGAFAGSGRVAETTPTQTHARIRPAFHQMRPCLDRLIRTPKCGLVLSNVLFTVSVL